MLDGEFIEHVCDHSDRSAWNCMTLIAGRMRQRPARSLSHITRMTMYIAKSIAAMSRK